MPWFCDNANGNLLHNVATKMLTCGRLYCDECATINYCTHGPENCTFSLIPDTIHTRCGSCQHIIPPYKARKFCMKCGEILCDNCNVCKGNECSVESIYTVDAANYHCYMQGCDNYWVQFIRQTHYNISFICGSSEHNNIDNYPYLHEIYLSNSNYKYNNIHNILDNLTFVLNIQYDMKDLADKYPQEYAETRRVSEELKRYLDLIMSIAEQTILFQAVYNQYDIVRRQLYNNWKYTSIHLIPLHYVRNVSLTTSVIRLQLLYIMQEMLEEGNIDYIDNVISKYGDLTLKDYIFIEAAKHNIYLPITNHSQLIYAIWFKQKITIERINLGDEVDTLMSNLVHIDNSFYVDKVDISAWDKLIIIVNPRADKTYEIISDFNHHLGFD